MLTAMQMPHRLDGQQNQHALLQLRRDRRQPQVQDTAAINHFPKHDVHIVSGFTGPLGDRANEFRPIFMQKGSSGLTSARFGGLGKEFLQVDVEPAGAIDTVTRSSFLIILAQRVRRIRWIGSTFAREVTLGGFPAMSSIK